MRIAWAEPEPGDERQAQAEQLAGMCAAYRACTWRALEPAPERNQTTWAIQAVQGRLSQARAPGMGTLQLALCEEEWITFVWDKTPHIPLPLI